MSMIDLLISDFSLLLKRGEQDRTLPFPDKKESHPRQSIVNKKNDDRSEEGFLIVSPAD